MLSVIKHKRPSRSRRARASPSCSTWIVSIDGNATSEAARETDAGSASGADPRTAMYADFTGRGDAEARAVQLIRKLVHEREMLPLEELERELHRHGLAIKEGGLGLERCTLCYLSGCGCATPDEWIVTDAGVEGGATERVVALI